MVEASGEGTQLGRYTLVRRIGVGGMGEVWLAKVSGAHGFEKFVALKRILPQFSSNPHVVNMLVDEARISVLLNHPNVVQVLELGEEEGEYFIAMEYVDGVSLSRVLRRLSKQDTRLDVFEACFVTIQILEGLHAAHVQKDHRGKPAGIIHRDVSPQNILLGMDGRVKVIDFGIARARERLEVTRGTNVKGKLRYMAPEQLAPKMIAGEPIDHRVDVFAAGILLFEMLAHRPRFSGENEDAIINAILKEDAPDLVREGLVERDLMDIIDTALEKDRGHRYADAAAFASDLREYLFKREPTFTAERIARRMRELFEKGEDAEDGGALRAARSPLRDDVSDEGSAEDGRARGDPEVTRTVFRHVDRTRGKGAPRGRSAAVVDRGAGDGLHGADDDDDVDVADGADGADDVGGRVEPRGAAQAQRRPPSRKAPRGGRPLSARRGPRWSPGRAAAAGLAVGTVMLGLAVVVLKSRAPAGSGAVVVAVVDAQSDPLHVGSASTSSAPVPAPELPPVAPRPPPAEDAADGMTTVVLRAEPATTRISLADRPDPKYVSPAHIRLPLQQTAELVFEADGYETVTRTLLVSPGMAPVDVKLAPVPVDLVIHVFPRDAVVTVNGGPAKPGMKVLPGEQIEVRAEHPFGLPRVVQVVPRPGEPLVVELKLDEVEKAAPGGHVPRGTLVITSRPVGAEVFIDGTRVRGVTPVETHVLAGPHRVTVRAQGGEQTFAVEVADGDTFKREIVLE